MSIEIILTTPELGRINVTEQTETYSFSTRSDTGYANAQVIINAPKLRQVFAENASAHWRFCARMKLFGMAT